MHPPVSFYGELHNCELIALGIPVAFAESQLPAGLKPVLWNEMALVTQVSVHLENMRPFSSGFPLHFHYQHTAFRFHVQHPAYKSDQGIYFWKSFSSDPFIGMLGKYMTLFHFESSRFRKYGTETFLRTSSGEIRYRLGDAVENPELERLRQKISYIDRAFPDIKTELVIEREKWPLQAVACIQYENQCIPDTVVLGAFKVTEPVFYHWGKPQAVVSDIPLGFLI